MEQSDDYTMYDAIRDITETDRGFFNIVRFLDGDTRNHIVAAQLRNTNLAYQLLRLSVSRPAPQERFVVNIPLGQLFDTSGTFMRNFMDPVPITPSESQIHNATQIFTNAPADTQCSICQEDVIGVHVRIRHCNHCFHQACIRQWFEVNPRCPVCRHDIRDLQPQETHNDNDNRVYADEE
jgi:Zn finger protein HypA/HybF involved in hydrogenase expression